MIGSVMKRLLVGLGIVLRTFDGIGVRRVRHLRSRLRGRIVPRRKELPESAEEMAGGTA